MYPLTIENLINNFEQAKRQGAQFVGVKIHMNGFPKDEVIINENENFDSKLEYYKKTYDENLNHKFATGISISGFTFSDDFDGIEADLIY